MDFISIVIFLLGAAVLAALIRCSMIFRAILDAFGRIEVRKSIYEEKLDKKGNVDTTAAVKVSYDRRRLEENRDAFNRLYPYYAVASQLIGLFPLLGILGTVLGIGCGALRILLRSKRRRKREAKENPPEPVTAETENKENEMTIEGPAPVEERKNGNGNQ